MERLAKVKNWDNFTANNAMRFKMVVRKPDIIIRATSQDFTQVIKLRLRSKIEENLAAYPRTLTTQAKLMESKSNRAICQIYPITTTAPRMLSVIKSSWKKKMSPELTKNT